MKNFDFRNGEVLLFDKPYHWTSFQVVNKIKYLIKNSKYGKSNHPENAIEISHSEETNALAKPILATKQSKQKNNLKIGHAGTLDPLATGLLIVCTGKQTKNIELYQAQEKEYTGTFYIGATTPCFDLEKEIDAHYPTAHITNELIYNTVQQFMGKQQQTPPLFSAIKINGQRAYDIARAGKTAEIKPKEITITVFEITRISLPEIDFRIVCSKGTYIRSIARDFGNALKSGAHLTALRRTRIGAYDVKQAMNVEEFEEQLR